MMGQTEVTAPLLTFAEFSPGTQALMQLDPLTHDIQSFKDKIELRMRELRYEIHALEVFQNWVACGIGRLPPEIMSRVFVMHRDAHRGTLSWIRVSHVCQRWREIAIADPFLWSDIGRIHPEFLLIMLHRSKSTPLTIRAIVDEDPRIANPLLQEALHDLDRVRTIHLVARDSEIQFHKALEQLVQYPKPAPLLEQLVLHAGGWGGAVPTAFLPHGAPRLRLVRLHGCSVHWASMGQWITGLTVLQLHNESHAPGFRPFTSQLHIVINQIPHLQVLELLHFLPHDPFATPEPTLLPTLAVGHLRSLKLYDSDTAIRDFFNGVQIPPSAIVDITITNFDYTQGVEFSHLMSSIARSWDAYAEGTHGRGESLTSSRSLEELRIIGIGSRPQIRERFECVFAQTGLKTQADLIISFTKSRSPYIVSEMLNCMDERFDFTSLRSLRVQQSPAISREHWKALFRDLPSLEVIALLHCTPSHLLAELDDEHPKFADVLEAPRAPTHSGLRGHAKRSARRLAAYLSLRTFGPTPPLVGAAEVEACDIDSKPKTTAFPALKTILYAKSQEGVAWAGHQATSEVPQTRPEVTIRVCDIPLDASRHPYYASEP